MSGTGDEGARDASASAGDAAGAADPVDEATGGAALSLHGPGGFSLDSKALSQKWLTPLWRFEHLVARGEGIFLAAALTLAALFGATAFFARNLGIAGSPWLEILPRQLTLGIGFVGAALATRGGAHIALDATSRLLPKGAVRWMRIVAETIAAAVSFSLCRATFSFVLIEREGGAYILDLVPSYVPALLLVWGFGAAALRFWMRAIQLFWPMLVGVPAVAALMGVGLAGESLPVATAVLVGLGALAGMPLFTILGGAALVLFVGDGIETMAVPVEVYRLAEAPTLVTLPLFTLMGTILAHGRAPERLVRLARAWLGWFPGGLVVATVIVCAFFTTFTGASGVTILALGLLLHRLLGEEGYSDGLRLGVITASGSIGLMFAPALPLIIYGIVAKVDIDDMFAAGIVPGFLLTVAVALVAVIQAHRQGGLRRHSFVFAEAVGAGREAIFELLLPVIVLGLLISGLATVVEAAAVGAVYTVVVAVFVKGDMPLGRRLVGVLEESGVLIGAVLVILGVALAFTGYLVDAEVPQAMVELARENLSSRLAFLLAVNLLLLVVGCILDIFSAIIIFVPLLAPVAVAFEVSPVHLGIIFLANLEIGYLTPPVGMNLFLSSFRFNRPLGEIVRPVLPFLLALFVALLLITYIPALSLWAGG